jgi:hypothetical protein
MKYKINPKMSASEALIVDIEANFEQSQCVLQDARNKIKKIEFNNNSYVVKSFKKPNLFNSLMYTFMRKSKAKRSYEYSLKIASVVPQAIGYVEFYHSSLLSTSFFVSEWFDYDFTIRKVLLEKDLADRDQLFKGFAHFSFQLHQRGVLHKDYSPGNILIKKVAGEYQFKIIDINRMLFKELSLKERMKNFSMLWASDADLEVISAHYAKVSGDDVSECQQLSRHYNQKNKRMKNFKRKLKGLPVSD